MKMATKHQIFEEKREGYWKGSKEEKGKILDAVCAVTTVHRKAAIRRFGKLQEEKKTPKKRGRKRMYGHGVVAALREVWNISGRICAERLEGIIAEYVRILKRDTMWKHIETDTVLLLKMSLGTLKNRIATFENVKKRGGRGTTKPSHLKEIIPVRRGPWDNPDPGFGEVDTVAHCGGTLTGEYAYTVQYTDVATIWTCLSAQWNKGEIETQKSIERIEQHLPFPLLGIDPDSGSEFINWHMKGWCDERKIQMTRTRPYMKNDHARIEQKNYANIRHIVGYARFDDPAIVPLLNELYDVLEDHLNFFVPSMKCLQKIKTDSKSQRVYENVPLTAYQRVLAHPKISPEIKQHLKQKYATLNPMTLKQKIDTSLAKLSKISTRLR
jgi:uncharacterized protein (UPF0297 family)